MSDSLPTLTDVVVITRAQVLNGAGFKPIRDTARALRRTRQALNAVRPSRRTTTESLEGLTVKVEEGGAPDWDIRLRAADQLYELADVRKVREEQHADSGRPLAIAIILDAGNGARAPLPTDGVRVHLSRGEDE